MAADWRRIAFAVVAAAALCAGSISIALGQSPKGPGAEAQADEEPDSDEAAKAKPGAKAAAKKKQDPAEARRVVEAASKLIDAGKTEEAARSLSATLAGGNLPPATLAKAFYVRGLAYKQQGKTAQAISDFTSALWLKGGLGGTERAEALKHRSAAYREAGLTEPGEIAVAGAPTSKSWWGGETGSTGASSTGTTGGNLWNSIFGGASSASAPSAGKETKETDAKAAEAKAPPAKPEPSPKAPGATSGWANSTEVHVQKEARAPPPEPPPPPSAKAPPAAVPPPPAVTPPPPARKADGRFKVQLGAVRTQAEAVALAAKAKREHASALAAREPEIAQTVFGNMGSFYLVRIGPFATVQETQEVCAKLKGSGFDCMSVTR